MFQQEDTSPKTVEQKESLQVLYTKEEAAEYNKAMGYTEANKAEAGYAYEGKFRHYRKSWIDISPNMLDWKSMKTSNTNLN